MIGDNDDAQMTAITQWFSDRGFGVQSTPDTDEAGGRFFWADLMRLPSGRVVAPMYGRGNTELASVQSAKERFEVEQ